MEDDFDDNDDDLFVWVDALRPNKQFFSHVGIISCLPEFNQRIKCLAQAHSTVTLPAVSLELATLRSQV